MIMVIMIIVRVMMVIVIIILNLDARIDVVSDAECPYSDQASFTHIKTQTLTLCQHCACIAKVLTDLSIHCQVTVKPWGQ